MTEPTPPPDDELDDDLELELEPVDPDILEHERQRAIHQTRKAEDQVDINEAYSSTDIADPFELTNLKKFRFSVRHLLIATALLSVGMTVFKTTGPCMGTVIIFALTVSSAWWFIIRQERRQKLERTQRQQEMKARIAAQRSAEDGDLSTPPSAPAEMAFDPPPEQLSFRFSFSLKEMLGAFTAAALVLGLIRVVGGAQNAAVLLGSIALLGLAVHAIGFEPPALIVLGWWILLVLYIVVGIMAALSPEQAAASAPTLPLEPVLALFAKSPT